MTMTPVASSNISGIGYDQSTRVLTVQFHRGAVYDYDDVPPNVHHEFLNADSKGRFFQRYIRNDFTATRRS